MQEVYQAEQILNQVSFTLKDCTDKITVQFAEMFIKAKCSTNFSKHLLSENSYFFLLILLIVLAFVEKHISHVLHCWYLDK